MWLDMASDCKFGHSQISGQSFDQARRFCHDAMGPPGVRPSGCAGKICGHRLRFYDKAQSQPRIGVMLQAVRQAGRTLRELIVEAFRGLEIFVLY